MPRAKTKQDLLHDFLTQYQRLMELIDSLTSDEQAGIFPFEDRDKNIRDVLIHLHEWHNMMLRWYHEGCIQKIKPIIPRAGYTWKTITEMNIKIWQMYQVCPLEAAKASLNDTHHQLLAIIEGLTEEELYTKGFYQWTGTTTLGQYLVSAGPSHYDWAVKKIKRYQKMLHQ